MVKTLVKENLHPIIGLDITSPDEYIQENILEFKKGNILNKNLLERLNTEFEVNAIYHLAAILSTRAEYSPKIAHDVNVNGTFNLLQFSMEQAVSTGKSVKFFFPSSIAVYGISTLEIKKSSKPVKEDEFRHPETIYGCNKLYCENLGNYYTNHYKRLSAASSKGLVDFRSIRFPGLLSAVTTPSGGTSDFAPEMIHAAAKGNSFSCFVRKDTQIPFMTMPDAIQSITMLMAEPSKSLSRLTYNVSAFSASAGDFRNKLLQFYPEADITFDIDESRQNIADNWPSNVNDSAAKQDWNWAPKHDFDSAFEDYLIPEIRNRYSG